MFAWLITTERQSAENERTDGRTEMELIVGMYMLVLLLLSKNIVASRVLQLSMVFDSNPSKSIVKKIFARDTSGEKEIWYYFDTAACMQ